MTALNLHKIGIFGNSRQEKRAYGKPANPLFSYGAEDWTRTSTPLRAQEPESCVSTNSTTSA